MRGKSAAFSSSPILSWHLPWVSVYAALGQYVCFPPGFIHSVFNHFRLDFCLLAWVYIQRIRGFFPQWDADTSVSEWQPVYLWPLNGKINNELSVEAYPDWAGEMHPSIGRLPPADNELSVESLLKNAPPKIELQFFFSTSFFRHHVNNSQMSKHWLMTVTI